MTIRLSILVLYCYSTLFLSSIICEEDNSTFLLLEEKEIIFSQHSSRRLNSEKYRQKQYELLHLHKKSHPHHHNKMLYGKASGTSESGTSLTVVQSAPVSSTTGN